MPKYGHLFFPLKSRMTFNLQKCIADADYRQGQLFESSEPVAMECIGTKGLQVPFANFAKNFDTNTLRQLPQDVQILSVGFFRP